MYWFAEAKKQELATRIKRNALSRLILQPDFILNQTKNWLKRLSISESDLFDSTASYHSFLQLRIADQEQLIIQLWEQVFEIRKQCFEEWREFVFPWVLRLHELILHRLDIQDQFCVTTYGIHAKGAAKTDALMKLITHAFIQNNFDSTPVKVEVHLHGTQLLEAFDRGLRVFDLYVSAQKIGNFEDGYRKQLLDATIQTWFNQLIVDWEAEMRQFGISYYDYSSALDIYD